jgi:hypothetical protein
VTAPILEVAQSRNTAVENIIICWCNVDEAVLCWQEVLVGDRKIDGEEDEWKRW